MNKEKKHSRICEICGGVKYFAYKHLALRSKRCADCSRANPKTAEEGRKPIKLDMSKRIRVCTECGESKTFKHPYEARKCPVCAKCTQARLRRERAEKAALREKPTYTRTCIDCGETKTYNVKPRALRCGTCSAKHKYKKREVPLHTYSVKARLSKLKINAKMATEDERPKKSVITPSNTKKSVKAKYEPKPKKFIKKKSKTKYNSVGTDGKQKVIMKRETKLTEHIDYDQMRAEEERMIAEFLAKKKAS